MAGIDEQLRMREMAIAGNPQAAQQKYAQSKDLMDLLVAQKVSNDYTTARNAMQANAQAPAGTVKDQLNMSNTQVTKNDMMRSLMPGVAIKAGRDQQAMQRQSMGIPSQPAPNQQAMRRRSMGIPSQPAPNIRMADGGIVGYADGGDVSPTLYDEMGKQYLPGQPLPEGWQTLSNSPVGTQLPFNPADEEFADELREMERTRRERGDRTFLEALKDSQGQPPLITAGDYMRDIGARRRFTEKNPNFASKLEAGKESREKVLEAQVDAFRARLKELNEAKAKAFPQEKAMFQQQVQDLLDNTPVAIRNAVGGAGMARGGVVGFNERGYVDSDAIADENDESRFDVTDNELSPEEAQELDRQRRFIAAQERATRLGEAAMNPQAVLARLGEDSKENASGILNALVNLPSTVTGSLYNLATQPNAVTRLMQEGAEKSGIAPFMRGADAPAMPTPDPAYGFFRGDAKPEPKDEAQAQTSGTPLGNRVPSKDAGKAVGGDPFNVQGMVDRLVEPEFRTQGVLDAPQIKGPPKKKGLFDNVDMGRLQAFLAGGGGQTTTAGALGGGLKGLMGEDQRREAIASKEAIEAAKISSQRYGVQQDFDAAMAKIGAENRRAVFKAQRDALEAYEGDKRELAADALFDITNGRDEQFNQELMLLRETYDKNPKVLTSKIAALTNETLDDRMRSVAGATGGSNSGVFEVELPAGG